MSDLRSRGGLVLRVHAVLHSVAPPACLCGLRHVVSLTGRRDRRRLSTDLIFRLVMVWGIDARVSAMEAELNYVVGVSSRMLVVVFTVMICSLSLRGYIHPPGSKDAEGWRRGWPLPSISPPLHCGRGWTDFGPDGWENHRTEKTTKIRGPQALLRRCLRLLHFISSTSSSSCRIRFDILFGSMELAVAVSSCEGSCHLVWWHGVGSCCEQLRRVVSSCLVAWCLQLL